MSERRPSGHGSAARLLSGQATLALRASTADAAERHAAHPPRPRVSTGPGASG